MSWECRPRVGMKYVLLRFFLCRYGAIILDHVNINFHFLVKFYGDIICFFQESDYQCNGIISFFSETGSRKPMVK